MSEEKIAIVTDSSANIPQEMMEGLDIHVIPVWLIWDEVQPNGSGQIIIKGEKTPLEFNSLGVNAVRLTAIPEPSTYVLMLLGLVGFMAYRRRTKA